MTEHNRTQRRNRLTREIIHFENQMAKFADQSDPQRKRAYTIACRCLKRRRIDLEKLAVR